MERGTSGGCKPIGQEARDPPAPPPCGCHDRTGSTAAPEADPNAMKQHTFWIVAVVLSALIASSGCLGRKAGVIFNRRTDVADFDAVVTEIEYPNSPIPDQGELIGASTPHTIGDAQVQYWDMSLEEAVELALTHSKVLRDLGGTVLRSPQSVQTPYEPAVQETDPRFGVDAALSAFDAEFTSSLFFEKNDRRYNNRALGDVGFFEQDLDVFEAALRKRAATGTQFALRKQVEFDNNSNIGNEFERGSWTVILEGEARHPLLQGGGIQFNRIAGPNGLPGVFQGVLVARLRTDVSLADFEAGMRDFVANVENAYWDLYFAYRDLDAKITARDTALETWRRVQALYLAGRRGGEAEKEAQARAQFFRFEEEVQNALAGRPLEGTRTRNGSTPGTFRGLPGVQVAERRLRLLAGLPPNGEQLIRPADEPVTAPVAFDWHAVAAESLVRRVELRRQRWLVKSRELELLASRNFLRPNLDLVGLYRFRGFGEELLDSYRDDKERFDNAFMDLTSGDFQEWQLGVEFSAPIGFRQAHAGVRNAELRLMRERTVLREQERQVVHDLSNAVAEAQRAYAVVQTNYNRRFAAKQQLDALQAAYEDDKADFYVVLDAQRRLAEAESDYFKSQVEYALAVRNVHFEKGTLLDYCGVMLAEGPWPDKAYVDAGRRERFRGRPRPLNYVLDHPPVVSRGPQPPPHRYTVPSGVKPLPDEPIPEMPALKELFDAPPSPPLRLPETSPEPSPTGN